MKRVFAIGIAAFVCWAAAASGLSAQPAMTPPPELKKLQMFVGDSLGKGKMYNPAGGTLTWTSVDKMEWALGGMYVMGRSKVTYQGMPASDGIMMMTYDPKDKLYKAWAFVSMMPGVMEMSGNFEDKALVFTSKPIDFGLGTGPTTVKMTFEPKSTSELAYKMEMKDGEKWSVLEDGVYTIKAPKPAKPAARR